jgi:hypothetical protein
VTFKSDPISHNSLFSLPTFEALRAKRYFRPYFQPFKRDRLTALKANTKIIVREPFQGLIQLDHPVFQVTLTGVKNTFIVYGIHPRNTSY